MCSAYSSSNYNVQLFPNPANDKINIYAKELFGKNVNVTISDFLGRSIFTETYPYRGGEFETEISLSKFITGIYFIIITDDNRRYIKKIIKE